MIEFTNLTKPIVFVELAFYRLELSGEDDASEVFLLEHPLLDSREFDAATEDDPNKPIEGVCEHALCCASASSIGCGRCSWRSVER